ncbi:6,7-dimethyl-8-ribityllumazine synthase [Marinibacterium profundimaris]|uniref:6,7-dimethyl-8-ribityllumazine synthase n=1 Tax=Marinibacterium profundimaris TaxID=1679460 RepID=A0A225NLF0_9RHOB|nr:6,7-dimethyl-8-ribityllumazine synthase [Marinibacterium profundimaris]OWU73298.1 riboflavin synthase subunit beta [Marinibacterium profundimaris]
MTAPLCFAFIKANWHSEIVTRALTGFQDRLARHPGPVTVEVFDVPGAFELPLAAQRLARSHRFDAIAAAALVVDGGIYRHDFVAQSVVSGLMQAQLETDVPILSISLTPHHFQPTDDHVAFFSDHFLTKGREAAEAALAVAAPGYAAHALAPARATG